MRELTGRQKEILFFIEKFLHDNGYSPTVREIGDHFQMSPRGAHDHVIALIKKERIKSQNGKPRTLTIIKREEGTNDILR